MISQKSVGRLLRLLARLMFKMRGMVPLLTWNQYRTQLYEAGIDRKLLDHAERDYDTDPKTFLPAIHDGSIPAYVYRGNGSWEPTPNDDDRARGQHLLILFGEVALQFAHELPDHLTPEKEAAAELLASLQLDGFEMVSGRLVPATLKGMNLEQEDDFLIRLIKSIAPPNMDVIHNHHQQADETFVNGNWGSASSETRNFFIAVLRGLRHVATSKGGLKPLTAGNDKNLIEDFRKVGLLTEEEKEAVLKLWVLLSFSGPHVGIQDRDRTRLTRLLVLGIAQWLCLKFIAWEKNGFKGF